MEGTQSTEQTLAEILRIQSALFSSKEAMRAYLDTSFLHYGRYSLQLDQDVDLTSVKADNKIIQAGPMLAHALTTDDTEVVGWLIETSPAAHRAMSSGHVVSSLDSLTKGGAYTMQLVVSSNKVMISSLGPRTGSAVCKEPHKLAEKALEG